MPCAARLVHLARCYAGEPDPWSLSAPDWAIAVPNGKGSACEGLADLDNLPGACGGIRRKQGRASDACCDREQREPHVLHPKHLRSSRAQRAVGLSRHLA